MLDFFKIYLVDYNSYLIFKKFVGFVFFLDFLVFSPWAKRFFGKDYQPNTLFNNNWKIYLFVFLWLLSSLSVAISENCFLPALILAFSFRYIYIQSRANNLFRGGGAVGMFPAFTATAIAAVELVKLMGLDWLNAQLILFLLLFHVGLTILDAGISKIMNGYYNNNGFQVAIDNPFWSYWAKLSLGKRLKRFVWFPINIFISSFQTLIGILMIIPNTQFIGVLKLSIGFIILNFILKLGNLQLLIGSYFLLFYNFNFEITSEIVSINKLNIAKLNSYVMLICLIYFFIAFFGQILVWMNFYFKVSFNASSQQFFNWLNYNFPVIIWRVFTPDVVNLYCLVYEKSGRKRILINKSDYTTPKFEYYLDKWRFFHVAESCVMSSIFNSVKYNDKNYDAACEKLLRYSKTLEPQLKNKKSNIEYDVYQIMNFKNNLEHKLVSKWLVTNKYAKRIFKSSLDGTKVSKYLRPFSSFGSFNN